jgi:hypothetical protein
MSSINDKLNDPSFQQQSIDRAENLRPAGPSKIQKVISKIKSKINAIKEINEKPDSFIDFNGDGILKKYGQKQIDKGKKYAQKKISDLKEKRKKIKGPKTDIFGEILDLVSTFLNKKASTTFTVRKTYGSKFTTQNFVSKDRLHFLAHQAINTTITSSKNIVMDNVKNILFAGDGICGSSTPITGNTLTIRPGEFDFMNVLTVNPTSNSGQIVYEPQNPSRNLIKMNRILYSGFSADQTIETSDGKKLFDLHWNEANQEFSLSGLTGMTTVTQTGVTVGGFFNDYYNNIEQLDLSAVVKTATMMVLKGDKSEPPLFDIGMNDLNRLLNKLMKVCNNPSQGLNQSAENQFNEDDDDMELYFDFDDVEGIDLDDEANRFNKVLKFTDCNNFTIPSNPSHYEDFVYLSKNNLDDAVNDVFLNTATTSYQEAGGTIPLVNFQISLFNSYILNLPKALIGSILSPKYILPIVIIYKYINSAGGNVVLLAKEIMKKLHKLFFKIIRDILWKFISEFWKLVKKDLLEFLKITALNIIKEKYKKYRDYILSIINLLRGILSTNLGDCNSLFTIIDKTIDVALYGGPNFQVPGVIDAFSYKKPGFSNTRTIIGIVEELDKRGVNASQPIFGQDNNLLTFLKSTVNGYTKEMNNNSYTHVANKLAVLPVVGGVVTIPPGAIVSYGGQT